MGENRATQAIEGGVNTDHLDALYLHEVVGLSYQEVADTQGVPFGTVQSRIHRAKDTVRRGYEVDEEGVLHKKEGSKKKLGPDNERVLFLVEHDGLSIVEAAKVLGIPRSTAKGRLQSARVAARQTA